jgi:hypothetical protein
MSFQLSWCGGSQPANGTKQIVTNACIMLRSQCQEVMSRRVRLAAEGQQQHSGRYNGAEPRTLHECCICID